MSTTTPQIPSVARPKRADALRNYERLLITARDAFAEGGSATSLEEIARRAGVGIGTLYRHFPNRQALLEAVYVEEVESLCRSADDLAELPPWEALSRWLHRFVAYMATKQALAAELLAYVDRDADLFQGCRRAFYGAGEPLFVRAQEAGVVRSDTGFDEVIQMVAGITKMPSASPQQIERVLDMALDGLRYGASA
ncbi:MAG TPA: TetR/AcrR family transcriptional regulator [Solirubrobacteraceae bacterium]|jgi:AcrR family transcriptional regulator